MKRLLFFIIFFSGLKSFCQETRFESLKLTSAPAFTILGVDPQNIERPSTPSDFIAGLQSAVVNNKLQPNFAVEATPYYWKHPKTNAAKQIRLYDFLRNGNNVLDNISRTFTFSFASSESDSVTFGGFDPGTGFGLGFRCNLLNGNVSRKTLVSSLARNKLIDNLYQSIMGKLQVGDNVRLKSHIDNWRNVMKNENTDLDALVNFAADFVRNDLRDHAVLTDSSINFLQGKIDKIEDEEADALATINEAVFPLTREGFMLEFAVADAAVVQNNEWNNLANAKTAIWLTPSYRINARRDPTAITYLDVMAVFRMTWNSSRVDKSDYFDMGAKLQYTHNRLGLSGEFIARMLTEKPETVESSWTNRLDLSFDYKINSTLTFKMTFGRNFDGNSVHYSDTGKMFAIGGLNFGFGDLLKNETSN